MKDKKDKKKSKKDHNMKEDPLFSLDGKESSTSHNKTLTVVGSTTLNDVPTELPKKFFENILIEEMELYEEFTMNKFLSLVNLYSIAIEYYLVMDPSKAKLYQNRMEYLLTNKDTLIQLKKQKNGNKIESKNEKEKNIDRKRKQTIATVKMRTDELKFDDLSEKVNKVISYKSSDKESVKNIIDEDIQKQNVSWKEKLQNKKKNKSGLSSNFNKKKTGSSSASYSDSPVVSKKSSGENVVSSFNEVYNNEKEKLDEKLEEDLGKIEEKEEENEEENKKDENSKIEKSKTENENEKSENKIVEDQKEENKIVEEKKEENEISEEKKEENEIVEEKKEENKIVEEKKEENEKEKDKEQNEEKKEDKIEQKPNLKPRKSIVEEDVLRQINVDDGVLSSVDEKIKILEKLVKNINISDSNSEDDDQSEDDEQKKENENNNKITLNKDKVPVKFQGAYEEVVKMMKNYMNKVNKFYYKDIFCMFSSELKELYELKCNKYIEIRNEYHQQIIENEYLLQNEENLNEEKKQEIQQTIDSLKEEQQHQIATIEDEFNRKILAKVTEFKLNSFKKNSGIQLIEEQLKLDVYSVINDSFY